MTYGITSDSYSDTLVVSKVPNVLTPVFSYMNGDNAVTEATTKDTVTICDECSFSGSPIKEHLWTVTKDGEEVYTGSEPYADYTSAAGEYVTSLVLTNEDGETSEPYVLALKVTEYVEGSFEESSEESIEESSEESSEESIEESSEESVEEGSEVSTEESSESSVEDSSVVSENSVASGTESSPVSNNIVANTGDSSSAALFSVLAVISALTAALVSVFAVQKKKQRSK